MHIFATTPKDTWNLPNWQRSWKLKATKYYETLKLSGYPWLILSNMWCLNIAPSSWRWHWVHPPQLLPNLISVMTNVKILLGFNAIMPLLEEVHSLIKFSQLHYVLVCDFIAIVKIWERDVYMTYYDNHYYFQGDVFGNFHAIINNTHESISFWWIMDLNIGTYHLFFEFVG